MRKSRCFIKMTVFGKDYLSGLREGLGDKAAKMIIATQTYETTDPTAKTQVVALPGKRRRCTANRSNPQIRRTGDPQSLRCRLEANAFAYLGVEFGRNSDEVGEESRKALASSRPPSRKIRLIRNGRTRLNTSDGSSS